MNIGMDAIKARVSVRTYDGMPLSAQEEKSLQEAFVEAAPGPFGATPRFLLVTRDIIEDGASRSTAVREGVRIGTYGTIVGAGAFVAGVVAKRPFACVDFGYCLEGIVLRATELGLGTCWIGGAFGRAAVSRALCATKDEFVPATTPVGHAAGRPRLRDRMVRSSARAGTRKDPSALFFEATESGALAQHCDPGAWAEVLESVRIGPSASNKQPWRLVVDRRKGEALHLAMQEDQRYNNMLGEVKLQELDMGIAMRHVEVASRSLGLKGSWKRLEPDPLVLEDPCRYISTFS